MHRLAPVALCLAIAGCQAFDARPRDVTITCSASGACPEGLRCEAAIDLCVPTDAPPAVVTKLGVRYLRADPLVPENLPLSALGPRSALQIAFSLGEEPWHGVAPTAVADELTGVTCRVVPDLTALNWLAQCAAPTNGADATFAVTVTALSAEGVGGFLTVPGLQLDLTSPPPVDVADAGAFLRVSPWGDHETNYRTSTRFVAEPGRVLEAVAVVVEQPGNDFATLIMAADAGARWQGETAPIDLAGDRPLVTSWDGAGNSSAAVEVRRVHWLATFSTRSNGTTPHQWLQSQATSLGRTGNASIDATATFQSRLWGDGQGTAVSGGAVWQRSAGATASGRERGVRGIYDLERSRVVRFGGISDAGPIDSTWEWFGSVGDRLSGDWLRRDVQSSLEGRPSGRTGAAMAWDFGNRAVALVGGNDTSAPLDDAWEWDGVHWRRLPSLPAGRQRGLLYFDLSSRRLTYAGGYAAAPTPRPEVFELDPVRGEWFEVVSPDGGAVQGFLPRRHDAALTFNARTRESFVFGGEQGNNGPTADLWRQNTFGTWNKVRVTGDAPSPRTSAAIAWDGTRDRLVLYGGADDAGAFDDTWEFPLSDGGSWRQLDAGTAPGRRADHALVDDLANGQLLLFGRAAPSVAADDDTWALIDDTWQLVAPATPLPAQVISPTLVPSADGGIRAFGVASGAPAELFAGTGWATRALAPDVSGWVMRSPETRVAWALSSTSGRLYEETDAGWVARAQLDGTTSRSKLANVLAISPRPGGTGAEFDLFTRTNNGSLDINHSVFSAAGVVADGRSGSGTAAFCAPFGPGVALLSFNEQNIDQPRLTWDLADGGVATSDLPRLGVPRAMTTLRSRDAVIVAGLRTPTGGIDPSVWELQGAANPDAGWQQLDLADVDGIGGPSYESLPSSGNGGGLVLIERTTAATTADAGVLPGDLAPVAVWKLSINAERPQTVLRFVTPLPNNLDVVEVLLRGAGHGTGGLLVALRYPGEWADEHQVANDTDFELSFDVSPLTSLIRLEDELTFRVRPQMQNGTGTSALRFRQPELEVRYER